MTLERQATFANGILVVVSVALAAAPATRSIGLLCTAFMGAGLVFSGIFRYCGWVRILAWFARNGAATTRDAK